MQQVTFIALQALQEAKHLPAQTIRIMDQKNRDGGRRHKSRTARQE